MSDTISPDRLIRQISLATLAALALPALLVLIQTAGLSAGAQTNVTVLYLSMLAGPFTAVGWIVCVLNLRRVRQFTLKNPEYSAAKLWILAVMPFIAGLLLVGLWAL